MAVAGHLATFASVLQTLTEAWDQEDVEPVKTERTFTMRRAGRPNCCVHPSAKTVSPRLTSTHFTRFSECTMEKTKNHVCPLDGGSRHVVVRSLRGGGNVLQT